MRETVIMHASIETKRAEIAELCERFGVARLDLFGSATTDAFDEARSDADFVVEFRRTPDLNAFRQYFDFKDELEKLLGRSVDLVERSAIRNPHFRARVEQTREHVYAS